MEPSITPQACSDRSMGSAWESERTIAQMPALEPPLSGSASPHLSTSAFINSRIGDSAETAKLARRRGPTTVMRTLRICAPVPAAAGEDYMNEEGRRFRSEAPAPSEPCRGGFSSALADLDVGESDVAGKGSLAAAQVDRVEGKGVLRRRHRYRAEPGRRLESNRKLDQG